MAELFFGDFRFDTRRLTLAGPDGDIEVRAKTLEVLTYLIQNRNRFVPRDELMEHLWPDVTVTASSLTQCISELRQALSDSPRQPRFIETKVKQGYRFVATVYHRPTEHLEALPPPPELIPRAAQVPATRLRRWLAVLLIAAAVLVALLWWWSARSEPAVAPVVVVGAITGDQLGPDARQLAGSARQQILDQLTTIHGATVSSQPAIESGRRGYAVELNCRMRKDGSLELTVSLRELPLGEAIWGWTWVIPEGSETAPAEIAERLTTAVQARLEAGH
jgi:DNA-binding winged helix-turn-helix (wHTH) protein